MKNSGIKHVIVFLMCVVLLGIAGCSDETSDSEIKATPSEKLVNRNLKISVLNYTVDGAQTVPLNSGNYSSITLYSLADVSIELNGKMIALEKALGEDKISGDEMIADARLDAAKGICSEVAKTKNGLTEFTYHYPEFSLHCVYDVYETPDGKQRLIKDLSLYGEKNTPIYFYSYDEDGNPIDYEDWGLNFRVLEEKPEEMLLQCFQAGGQQIGTLELEMVLLYRNSSDSDEAELVQPIAQNGEKVISTEINMGGITEIPIDFATIYGVLSSGNYELSIQVADQYDQDARTTLTRKYHDTQWYGVVFTIA